MIGQTISQYKITAKLGAGGMGEVYLATDGKLHREVALKFLPQQFSDDPDARSRFQREARALAALNHPNIVTVHDVSEYEGQPFIAMEYLRGKSLKDIISDGDIALERVIDFTYQIGLGLAAAHKAEVVHRDIKSENIIVSPDGCVKVMDFGLATWRGVTQITKEGSTVGTMSYMSPEQAQGKDVDQRTDLWSLGVVLYEMLTGRLPFQGDHEAAVVYSIVQDTPQPPLRYRSDIPPGLDEIVTRALEKDPETRYQTAAGFLSDITRFRKASEASLAATSVTSPAPQPKRGHLPLVISAVALFAVVIALLVFKPWQSDLSTDASRTSTEKTLAVLPFENLGAAGDEYFSDGITDEITSRLARIGGLHVISRTSANQYKGTKKSLQDIGGELGVDYILEGTIRWDKSGDTNRVRITPQLIRVENDFHVWADSYERAMTQIFAVQTDIAGHIASALDVALDDGANQARPTDNAEAYAYFLQAREYSRSILDDYSSDAVELYERAIALDSNFGDAYAGLGLQLGYLLWDEGFGDTYLRSRVDWAINQAMTLSPESPLVYQAKGYYYTWIDRDYDLALQNYQKARDLGADQGEVLWQIAQVQMRQGRWDDAERSLIEATQHDPRSASVLGLQGTLYAFLNRHDEALAINQKALTLAPYYEFFYAQRVRFLIWGPGDTASAAQTLRDGIHRLGNLRPLLRTSDNVAGDIIRFRLIEASPEQVRDAYRQKSRRREIVTEAFALANAFDWIGMTDSARVYYDSVLILLEENAAKSPHDFHNLEDLVVACIHAGRYDEAVEYGRVAREVMPVSTCHW